MEELFYEVINEASVGKVIIDVEEWPIGFDIVSYPYEVDSYIRVLNRCREVILDNELLDDVSASISL